MKRESIYYINDPSLICRMEVDKVLNRSPRLQQYSYLFTKSILKPMAAALPGGKAALSLGLKLHLSSAYAKVIPA